MALDAEDVRELLCASRGREGRELEFKRGLPRDPKVARSLCAFANTRGGTLLVGVEDDGRIAGAPRPRETVRHLREVAREWVEPPLKVEVSAVRLDAGTVVACFTPLSAARPHAARTEAGEPEIVVRVGASNRRAGGATLRALQRPNRGARGLTELQRGVLAWLEARGVRAVEGATPDAFSRARNVGRQRARRAFVQLEAEGLLVAHGVGVRRFYSRS